MNANAIASPGCVILLIDESAGMSAVMRDLVADGNISTKPNAHRVATSVNSLLAQLSGGPDFDLAVVGYRTDAQGQVNVGCRWGGALTGREFVPVRELADNPLRRESRVRKSAAPGGGLREETIEFPVWYEPASGVKAPQIAAYDYCRELLSRWSSGAGPQPGTPLVLHVFSGSSQDGNPQLAIDKLLELQTPGGPPLVLQVHLAASSAVVTSLYPSTIAYLTVGAPRDLFRRASLLPAHLVAALRAAQVTVSNGARGMIHNAKIGDMIRCFAAVKSHVKSWPASAATSDTAAIAPKSAAEVVSQSNPAAGPSTPASVVATDSVAVPSISPAVQYANGGETEPVANAELEQIALVLLVLDRSVADPYSGAADNPCARLQDQANDLLKQISKMRDVALDVAIVSYGTDSAGQPDVRESFDGPLTGQAIVRHTELAAGAVRIEEFEEQVSNGIGGLVTMTRKQPIYFDLEPTAATQPSEAFKAIHRIIGLWCSEHPQAAIPPVVLHLTRGSADQTAMEASLRELASLKTAAGATLIYHLVLTESPQKSLAYPDSSAEIQSPEVQRLWDLSSELWGWQQLSGSRPDLKNGSRGFVANGKFDLLVASIQQTLAHNQTAPLSPV